MAAQVTFNSNLDEVLDAFVSAEDRILLDIGTIVQDDAATNSPVRTGTLRKSWTVEVNQPEHYVKIGVPEDDPAAAYAVYVENGTSKQPARHMLRDAVNNRKSEFPQIAKIDMQNVW